MLQEADRPKNILIYCHQYTTPPAMRTTVVELISGQFVEG